MNLILLRALFLCHAAIYFTTLMTCYISILIFLYVHYNMPFSGDKTARQSIFFDKMNLITFFVNFCLDDDGRQYHSRIHNVGLRASPTPSSTLSPIAADTSPASYTRLSGLLTCATAESLPCSSGSSPPLLRRLPPLVPLRIPGNSTGAAPAHDPRGPDHPPRSQTGRSEHLHLPSLQRSLRVARLLVI